MSFLNRMLERVSGQSGLYRARRRRPFSPFEIQAAQVETLEVRTLLSAYVVGSLTDTGAGSGLTGDLRYCITNAASGNDTITFAQGLTGAIKLESTLTLNASVAIQGPGANLLTVEPDSAQFVFFAVGSTASVELSGLTIYGKNDVPGDVGQGAIDNAGTLSVSACTFADNSTGDGNGGGAIINSGTATVSNCTFTGNGAKGYYNGQGGAITNYGVLTLNSSSIQSSFAYGIDGARGGAISNWGTATINASSIEGNHVYGVDFSNCDAYGGAIDNEGALTINNSTLANNVATGGSAGFGFGSSSGGGSNTYSAGAGGGIYLGAGTLSINSSTLSDNQAAGGNAGSMYLHPGNGYGGGLYVAGGTASISNSTVADNSAIRGFFTPGITSGVSYGGGIYNAARPSSLLMYDSILADNSAIPVLPGGYWDDPSVNSAGPDLDGGITSLGHNLIGNSTGGSGFAASDLVNVNPHLGALHNNGGPTQTRALLAGSHAINAGDIANAPAYDQRGAGFTRLVNGAIDIGAFEVQTVSATQASRLAISGFPASIQAGAAGSFTVTAKNADGTTAANYTGTVHFTSSDSQAVLPANYTFTAADAGIHTFSATLKTAGTQSLTAGDTTTNSIIGSEAGISVKPAAASTVTVSGFPTTTTAGVAHNVTVTLNDAYGNTATGYIGQVHFTSTDGKATLPANYTFTAADAGAHTFSVTLKTAGPQSITAADTLTSALKTTAGGITVNAAAASSMTVGGFPTTTTAGVAHNVTVTLKDPYGNTATGYTGQVHFTSRDAKASLPANYTFTAGDAGVHNFSATLKTAGTWSITVADTLMSALKATEGGITVTAGAASQFTISAPSSVKSDVAFSLTLTVADAYGNVVTGYTGTVHFSSTDNLATLHSNYTFTTNDRGVHTFTGLVLRKKGTQNCTVKDTLSSLLTASVAESVH